MIFPSFLSEQEGRPMKTVGIIIWSVAALMTTDVVWELNRADATNVIAVSGYKQDNPDLYCAKMRDGKLIVIHDGKELTTDMFLKNGSTIKPDGTVITREGVRTNLKEGECIDGNGKINGIKKGEPYQKEE